MYSCCFMWSRYNILEEHRQTCVMQRGGSVQLPRVSWSALNVPFCQCIIHLLVKIGWHSCLFPLFLRHVPVGFLATRNGLLMIIDFFEFWHQKFPLILTLLCTFMDPITPPIILYPFPSLLCSLMSLFQVGLPNPVKILSSPCLPKEVAVGFF